MDFANRRSALDIREGATVTLKRSLFACNTQEYGIGAAITLFESSVPLTSSPDQDVVLRLEDVTFQDLTEEHAIAANQFQRHEPLVYSNQKWLVKFFTDDEVASSFTLPLEDAPTDRPGINASTPWFVNALEVCLTALLEPHS